MQQEGYRANYHVQFVLTVLPYVSEIRKFQMHYALVTVAHV